MTIDRIKDLANKGFITQIGDMELYAKLSEAELVNMGYISQIGIFDGENETKEEIVMDVVETPEVDTPKVEDTALEITDYTSTDDVEGSVDDEPIVDEGDEPIEE